MKVQYINIFMIHHCKTLWHSECHRAVQAFLQSTSDLTQTGDSQPLPSTQPDHFLIPTTPRWSLSLPHSHSLFLMLKIILSCFSVNTGTGFPNKLLFASQLSPIELCLTLYVPVVTNELIHLQGQPQQLLKTLRTC